MARAAAGFDIHPSTGFPHSSLHSEYAVIVRLG